MSRDAAAGHRGTRVTEKNRHWKESIGVLPKTPRPPGAQPGTPAGTARAPARPEPVSPADPSPDGADPLFPESSHTLEPLEALLDGLPFGSSGFARQVARDLWPAPAAADLQALGHIIENRHVVPRGDERSALYRAIVLKRRSELLWVGSRTPAGDADVLMARAAQWERLARAAHEIHQTLRPGNPADPAEGVFKAARTLIPPPALLEGEAAVASASADMLTGANNIGTRLAALIPEAIETIDAFRRGQLSAAQSALVDVAAGFLVVDADLRSQDRNRLMRDRILLERLLTRLDESIEQLVPRHTRAPERNAWLAAWRRRALDLKVHVDEQLTRPTSESDTPDSGGQGRTAGGADADEALIRRLRELRGESEPGKDDDSPGWLGWLRRLGRS